MPDDINQVPSAWSAHLPILAGVFRGALALLGGAGFVWANTVSGSQIEMAASLALALAAVLWSGWQKIAALKASRASSVASAQASAIATHQAGTPVAIVESAGTPTTTTDLNRAEIARHAGGTP